MIAERVSRTAGVGAIFVFWGALFTFAALYPGYSHYTKAISELGAFGAPHALLWNLIGFIVPGILLAVCGGSVAFAIDGRRTLLFWLLIVSGLGFAGTGVFPAEMRDGSPLMQSPWTAAHVVMTFVSAIPWVIGALVLVGHVKRSARWRHRGRIGRMLGLVAVAGLAFNIFARAIPLFMQRPGLAQRIAFAVYFAWFLAIALLFLEAAPKVRRPPA